MIKTQLIAALFVLSGLAILPQVSFAQEQPSAEELKLRKDKVTYKAYIPAKYHLFEAIEGDLNKDGLKDVVLIVKATDPKAFVHDEYRGHLDRNRRGAIVLLNEKGKYKAIVSNLNCFSSENEDGGVYFPPDLWMEIKNNVLSVYYSHGRYGYWRYLFRLEGNDLRLIGYDDSSNHGPLIQSQTSINFLTGKKVIRKNMSEDEEADPRFKETWSKINQAPIYLSKVKDFNDLSF
ncbi:hypothetical protein NDN11_17565 [Acinetobacter sp. C26M]|uniref:hypothetical protein n=1 Tax=unclassified Acinetobacter TaxID=196816 RepID=UPI002036AA3A|nr:MULTISPECIES: hypothetical protein [unclassified Acinetobacter]USA46463.1 hypothetical protein NDN11_17565 [Acinetobacter sp. C26M]USA49947.1 hypothetical protein NDN12_17480 [Acinetobacter sp. C26G]